MNNNLSDLGAEMANSIAKDGQTQPTSNLPMNGFKHTNVANGSVRDDYTAVGQVQDGGIAYDGTATGTANAIETAPTPNVTALAEGMEWLFTAASDNTGAVTIQRGTAPAVAGQINDSALTGGEILTGKHYRCFYDGTAVQVTRLSAEFALVSDTSPQLGGVLDSNSHQVRLSRGSNVTAATSMVIPDDGNQFTVLGNTEIEGLSGGGEAGTEITLIFNGAPNLKHGSNFSLPGQADIQAAGNDIAVFAKVNNVTQAWFCTTYTKADGTAVVGGNKATQSAIEAETVEDTFISPDTGRYIPGASKAGIVFDGTLATATVNLDGVLDSYNIASLVEVSTGVYTINFTDNFANAFPRPVGTAQSTAAGNVRTVSIHHGTTPSAGSVTIQINDANGNAAESSYIAVELFGTQA